jgi:hypothetical protein
VTQNSVAAEMWLFAIGYGFPAVIGLGWLCWKAVNWVGTRAHLKAAVLSHPWIIATLICSASAAYAAEDDGKIHPTCVEENNTRRCWVDHGPPTGVRPPQLQPVAPAAQATIPPPPAMVPVLPPPRWWPLPSTRPTVWRRWW